MNDKVIETYENKKKKRKKRYQAFPSRLLSKNSSTKADHGELSSMRCQGNADMEKITLYVTPLKSTLIFLGSYPIHSAVLLFSEPSLLFIIFYLCFPRYAREGKK